MKIRRTFDGKNEIESLTRYVNRVLKSYDSGVLERVRYTNEKLLYAFARLIDCLADKGLLDGTDISEIVTSFRGPLDLVAESEDG